VTVWAVAKAKPLQTQLSCLACVVYLPINPDRLKEVTETLKDNGFTDEDIETLMYYRPSFFVAKQTAWSESCCRRRVGYTGVSVLCSWHLVQNWIARLARLYSTSWHGWSKGSKQSALGDTAWTVFGPSWQGTRTSTCSSELDADGMPKTDKYGICLIRCKRGMNAA